MNKLFQFFNLYVSSYDDFITTKRRLKQLTKSSKKVRRKNRLYRDLLRGLKKNELMILHANIKRVENIIDEFAVLENIFVPF